MKYLSVVMLVLVLATSIQAKERYHAARGSGHFTDAAGGFVSEGIATHVGPFSEVGAVQLTPTDDPAVFQLSGSATHTAANGDQLFETIAGTLNVVTGAGTATMTFVGGTGRFANASGSAIFELQLVGDGAFVYTGEGTIDY